MPRQSRINKLLLYYLLFFYYFNFKMEDQIPPIHQTEIVVVEPTSEQLLAELAEAQEINKHVQKKSRKSDREPLVNLIDPYFSNFKHIFNMLVNGENEVFKHKKPVVIPKTVKFMSLNIQSLEKTTRKTAFSELIRLHYETIPIASS